MSLILVSDTETTGLIDFRADKWADHQPNAVEVAAVLYDDDADAIVASFCAMVKPQGFSIDNESVATKTHGITHEKASEFGLPGVNVASMVARMAEMADEFMAYNKGYDIWILDKMFEWCEVDMRVSKMPSRCAMTLAKAYCKMPPTDKMVMAGFTGYKPPKLSEAYKICTGKDLIGAHSAMTDVMATVEIYRFLKQRARDAV